jgi:ELWxxDGT repeat protein
MSRSRIVFRPAVRAERLEGRRLMSAGLELLSDINPISAETASEVSVGGSSPSAFWKFSPGGSGGEVGLFAAFNPERGRELWRTDGTAAGTSLVKDIAPGVASSNPSGFADLGGKALFLAQDPQGRKGIWATDGTEAGTVPIPLPDGLQVGDLGSLAVAGDAAYFGVVDRGDFHAELWRTDGTPEGTRRVLTVPAEDSVRDLVATSGRVFFQTLGPGGTTLWGGDPASGSVQPLRTFAPTEGTIWKTAVAGDRLYAAVKGQDGSARIWTSDGTEAGTRPLDGQFRGIDRLIPFGDRLVFSATSDGAKRYWSAGADGTIGSFGPAPSSGAPALVDGGTLYFVRDQDASTTGAALWASDGTDAGTRSVAILSGPEARGYSSIAKSGDRLYLYDLQRGGDGTETLLSIDPGSGAVDAIAPVDVQADPQSGEALLVVVNGRPVFAHRDPQKGLEPYTVAQAQAEARIEVQSAPNLSLSTRVAGLDRVLATFRPDSVPADGEFAAVVDWGDGTPPEAGKVIASNGTIRVLGQHAYQDPGQYAVAVTLRLGSAGPEAVASGTATVAEPTGASGVVVHSAPSSLVDGRQTNVFTLRNTGTRAITGPLLLQLLNAPGAIRTGIGIGTSVQLRPGAEGRTDVVLSLLRPLEPGKSLRIMVAFDNPSGSPALVLARLRPDR